MNWDYRFFREHAGARVGHAAEDALALARAERLLDRAEDLGVASVRWEHEEGWSYDDLDTEISDEEKHGKFQHGEWTGPFVCIVETINDDFASLGMVVLNQWGTNDPYARVVRAELARELEDALRQAVGDALDADERETLARGRQLSQPPAEYFRHDHR